MLEHGVLRDVIAPGQNETFLSVINDANVIGGYAYIQNVTNPQAFATVKGRYRSVTPPGTIATFPMSINKNGVIAGAYESAQNSNLVFLATPK